MSLPIFAAAQLCSTDDLAANLQTCRDLAAKAAGAGAQVLGLPECFAFIGRKLDDKLAVAEVLDQSRPGPILQTLTDIAVSQKLWVVAGGLPEKPPTGGAPGRVWNSCIVLNPTGNIVAIYRKIHLFDIDIPGKAEFCESNSTLPGQDLSITETPFGKFGLTICYDIRFPELYRQLRDRNADIIWVPAAFTAHTGAAHWHTLLRARAIENQCYIIAPAQTGAHHSARSSYGHSLIIDPWGTVIAELPSDLGIITAPINLELIAKVRKEMPCFDHRRIR